MTIAKYNMTRVIGYGIASVLGVSSILMRQMSIHGAEIVGGMFFAFFAISVMMLLLGMLLQVQSTKCEGAENNVRFMESNSHAICEFGLASMTGALFSLGIFTAFLPLIFRDEN